MKTKIRTQELLEIVNPFKDGIVYKGHVIHFELHELQRYVEYPEQNNVFSKSENVEISFYKNLALYIINAENDKYIELDLNKPNPLENGLFEYLKNIYNKQEHSYIMVDEVGDNNLLIKAKKLLPLSSELVVPKAIDVELGELSSVFLHTEKIADNDKFFWKEDSADMYSKMDYIINKLKPLLAYKPKILDEEFHRLISMANKTIVNSDEFKLELLNLDNANLNVVLVEQSKPEVFKIDFSEPVFQEHILQQFKTFKFGLFEELFKSSFLSEKRGFYRNNIVGKAASPKHKIDYALMMNQPEVISHLISMYQYRDTFGKADDTFNVTSCYHFLNDENKNNHQIIEKYLDIINYEGGSGHKGTDKTLLFKLPLNVFNDRELMSTIVQHTDLDDLKKHFKSSNFKSTLMKDPDFILECAKNIPYHTTEKWCELFLSKKSLTKDFITNLIKAKPNFFSNVQENKFFDGFLHDVDLLKTAINNGFKPNDLRFHYIEPLLIQQNDEETEKYLVQYLVENSGFKDNITFSNPEHSVIFTEKYVKLELMYLMKRDHLWHNETREQTLKAIKDPQIILDALNNAKPRYYGYAFCVDSFYKELNPLMRKNKDIVNSLIKLGTLKYKSLSENLLFNSELALKFISLDPQNVSLVRQEFFNDIDFSLKFAKLMDEGKLRGVEKFIPPLITKFFENQEVTENYHDYLKKYIAFNSLKNSTEVKEEVKPVRRSKI